MVSTATITYPPFKVRDPKQAIVDLLEVNPEVAFTIEDLAEYTNMSRWWVGCRLHELEREDRVEREVVNRKGYWSAPDPGAREKDPLPTPVVRPPSPSISKHAPLQKHVVAVLKATGPITRGKLVEKLDRARTTIYDNIAKLMAQGLVRCFPSHDGKKRGRPLVLFELVEEEAE